MLPYEAQVLRFVIPFLLLIVGSCFIFSRDNAVRCAGIIIEVFTLTYLGAYAEYYSFRSVPAITVFSIPIVAGVACVASTWQLEWRKSRKRKIQLSETASPLPASSDVREEEQVGSES